MHMALINKQNVLVSKLAVKYRHNGSIQYGDITKMIWHYGDMDHIIIGTPDSILIYFGKTI